MFSFFFFIIDGLQPKADVYLCITGTRIYAFKTCVQPDIRSNKEFELLSIRLEKLEMKVIADNSHSSHEG